MEGQHKACTQAEHKAWRGVKPTETSGVSSFGKSCIMHSRRVGFLNLVFSALAYLGGGGGVRERM